MMVMVERVWPRLSLVREGCLAAGGVALLALTAQVQVPMWPVPLTGQTFGVLLLGALYGPGRAAWTTVLYLATGALGLPVFAGGAFGAARLVGPTGGYLAGFVAAAALVGWLSRRGWDRSAATAFAAMLAGAATIHLFGVLWLATLVGWGPAVTAGLLPFIPGDLVKAGLAALALPAGWRLLGRRSPGRQERPEPRRPEDQDGA